MTRYVIIGMGVAGAEAADTIRKLDPEGEITILNGEGRYFYFRPALSWFLKGKIEGKKIFARPGDWAQKRNMALFSERAVYVSVPNRTVTTETSQEVGFDRLLIAAGATAIKPPWPGINLRGVFTYRTLGETLSIAKHIKNVEPKTAVVVGGGILGVELADIFRHMGLRVTLVVRQARILTLLFDETGSSIIQRRMEAEGVKIVTNANVKSITGKDGRVAGVELDSGESLESDIVGVAVGVRPVADFLRGSDLIRDGRLAVSARLETLAKDVYAAGDIAFRKTETDLVPCRTWLDSAMQGRLAGLNMTGGNSVYNNVKTFFNASTVFGRFYAVIGRFNEPEGGAIQSRVVSNSDSSYVKVITENGKIIGGVSLYDMRAALSIRRAVMENRAWTDNGAPG